MTKGGFDNGFSRSLATDDLSAGFGRPGFSNPVDIGSDLILWLDAMDSDTLYTDSTETTRSEVGSSVGRWKDKSGYGRHASQTVAANKPTKAGTGYGGRPMVSFDGAGDGMSTVAVPSILKGELWTVHSRFYSAVIIESYDGAAPYFALNVTSNWVITVPSVPSVLATGALTTSPSLFRVTFDNTTTTNSVTMTIDGSPTYTGNGTMQGTGNKPIYMGKRYDGSYTTGCSIGEVIMINRSLTSDESFWMKRYLRDKWGTP